VLSKLSYKVNPDVNEFKEALTLKRKPSRVHIGELHIDKEIVKEITEKVFQEQWIEPVDRRAQEKCLLSHIGLWHNLGFDCVRLSSYFRFSANLNFPSLYKEAADTALLKSEKRRWAEERCGIITNWEDFENYNWPDPENIDLWPFEFTAKNLPEGMGMWGCLSQGFLESTMFLIGYENLCLLLYDNPELVKAVFDRVGTLILKANRRMSGLDNLVGFFQGDDMGFKTGELLPPDVLRKYVLPWHKKLADLAHENNLLYILHSCGDIKSIMEDLISSVKIDAKHSFDDGIMPVSEFKKKFGHRTGIIGEIDIDKLCRLDTKQLRKHVRNILEECMQTPGYILGSNNSIANYVPVDNFLAMIEEGFMYK